MTTQPIIIGIGGLRQSGKDTVSSMLNYIFDVGVSKAKFDEFLIHKARYDFKHENRVIHFADDMKKCLSIIYHIPLKYFYNTDYKDNKYYCISESRFIEEKDINSNYKIVTIEMLDKQSLNNWIKAYESAPIYDAFTKKHIDVKIVIKLRTLMQYFGTTLGRQGLGESVWINCTKKEAHLIAERYKVCLIPDVRISNEANAIINAGYKSAVIFVNRPNLKQDDHLSEALDFDCTHEIRNDGTKLQLFYKVLNFVQTINKN